MSFFGFIPSDELLATIKTSHANRNSTEPLYPLRDKIALLINDEIIDAILTDIVQNFPASDKRESAEKLAGYVKSTITILLKQLLSPVSNDVVQQSIEFSERSLFKDEHLQERVGLELDPLLVSDLKHLFAEVKAGREINTSVLGDLYKQFSEATVIHFMNDFNQTLDLGLIKRKAASLASSAVIKTIHLAIDKIILNLTAEELLVLSEQHDTLFYL